MTKLFIKKELDTLESVHNCKVIEIDFKFEFHRYANWMTTKRDGGLYSEGHLWTLSAVKVAGGKCKGILMPCVKKVL